MGETPQSKRKAPATPRAREKAAGPDRINLPAASPQPFSSIPRMPKILSPAEIASHYPSSDIPAPPPGDQGGSDSGKRRTLMDGATGRRAAVNSPGTSTSRQSPPPVRRREQNAARPLSQMPGTLKLPAIPEEVYATSRSASPPDDAAVVGNPYGEEGWDDETWDGAAAVDDWEQYARQNVGRELVPLDGMAPETRYPIVSLSPDSVPDLAAFRLPLTSVKPRRRVNTQMLIERARSPWSITRTILAVVAMIVALFATIGGMGEPSQKLMQTAFAASAGSGSAFSITGRVQPETQLLCPSCYDNSAQFQDWGDAACSAASASEVLTAWGVRGASIGKMIDAMGPDISLNGGLLTINGYQRGVSHFGYRADISSHLTYNQMIYITHTLGLPVIVNVRISYGYFHFFSGGHFLVVTDGDAQGVTIVDSSEYYIKYLPRDVLYSMFTGITVVIVPNGFYYSVPNI
jgi:hypothetical protein